MSGQCVVQGARSLSVTNSIIVIIISIANVGFSILNPRKPPIQRVRIGMFGANWNESIVKVGLELFYAQQCKQAKKRCFLHLDTSPILSGGGCIKNNRLQYCCNLSQRLRLALTHIEVHCKTQEGMRASLDVLCHPADLMATSFWLLFRIRLLSNHFETG